MMTKRTIDEHKKSQEDLRNQDDMINEARKNYGKTTISGKKSTNLDDGDFTPYEEV
ncbi:MAG: hypothetical protein MK078_17905 [Crocinitomicaceae bacterium]|nr:hypothetical protein [Crocinitomicaceae bacterium]